MPQPLTYWTEPPTNVRVYPCPQCQETISVNAPSCRFCHVPVELKVAEQLWAKNQQLRVENQQIGTAIKRADMYSFFTRALVVITAITVWRMYRFNGPAETWIVFQLLALSYGAQWLNHNSSIVTADAKYGQAVAKVKTAMLGWAALLLFQVAAYFLLNGLPDWNSILELLVLE